MRAALMFIAEVMSDHLSATGAMTGSLAVANLTLLVALFKLYQLLMLVQQGLVPAERVDWARHLADITDIPVREKLYTLLQTEMPLLVGGASGLSGGNVQDGRSSGGGLEPHLLVG